MGLKVQEFLLLFRRLHVYISRRFPLAAVKTSKFSPVFLYLRLESKLRTGDPLSTLLCFFFQELARLCLRYFLFSEAGRYALPNLLPAS